MRLPYTINKKETMKLVKYTILLLIITFSFACTESKISKKEVKSKEIQRIVSLVPSVTKELVSLGLKDKIVGATSYCKIAENNEELVVGSATMVNTEKLIMLKPDIVFVSTLAKKNTIDLLEGEGINVHFLNKVTSFNEICNQFLTIGKLTNKEKKAREIIEYERAKIDSLKSILPSRDKSLKVFFQIGAKPLFTVTPNTFMDDYITYAGAENIASDLKIGTITRESVLLRNPDVIIIVTMGIVGEEEQDVWKSYTDLSATKKNKIFVIDSDLSCSPTPDNFTTTFEQIINFLK